MRETLAIGHILEDINMHAEGVSVESVDPWHHVKREWNEIDHDALAKNARRGDFFQGLAGRGTTN